MTLIDYFTEVCCEKAIKKYYKKYNEHEKDIVKSVYWTCFSDFVELVQNNWKDGGKEVLEIINSWIN